MVTSAMEDTGVLRALQLLAQVHRADPARVMVLRTASDYVAPGAGQTAAQLLAAEAGGGGGGALSAYRPALDAAFKVGAPVVRELSGHWERYRDHPPGVGR
jgi:purine nucleoside permease